MSEKNGSGEKIKAYLTDIKEFKPDPQNANRHTLRGRSMVEKGMEQRGYARPAFAASDGTVLGGNLSTMEVAPGIGLGDGKVFVVESDGTIPIIHKRVDVEAGSSEARLLALEDNRTGQVSLDFDPLVLAAEMETGLDLSGLWDDSELAAILEAAGSALAGENEKRQITRTGRLYNAGDGHNVEPFKLAYRIEAIWRASGNLALDLFSGEGQLAAWYKRRFKRVVTVDKSYQVGDVDYSMPAGEFIDKHIQEFIDFDFIDFDDEGTPAREIQRLFKAIEGCKAAPFVLALTDGNGMNLKFRGKLDFLEVYQTGESGIRHATRADYDNFEDTVTGFIERCATGAKFTPTMLSSYRGREGNVLFQTWLIEPVSIASR